MRMTMDFFRRLAECGQALYRIRPGAKMAYSVGIPLVAAGALAFALFSTMPSGEREDDRPVKEILRGFEKPMVAGVGLLEPKSETIEIGSHLSGIVAVVHVKVGQQVAAGEALFTLDEREARAQWSEASARLEAARAEAKDARERYRRVRELRGSGALSEEEFTSRLNRAETADATVRLREAELERVGTVLDRLTARAPIAGTVLSLNVRPGEFVPAGQTTVPLLRLGDISELHVRVFIDETEAERVRLDVPAEGQLRGWRNERLALRFIRIEPFAKPKRNLAGGSPELVDTRTVELLYALEGTDARAISGRQMDVFLPAHAMPLRKQGTGTASRAAP